MAPTGKEKQLARLLVAEAVKKGLLYKPKACTRCDKGDCPIQGHHADYSKPLDVEWLCIPCHILKHKGRHPRKKKAKLTHPPEYISISDACKIYGTDRSNITKAIANHKFTVIQIGRTIRIWLRNLPASI